MPTFKAVRRADWSARLGEVVSAYRDRPFRYGKADCARFASDCAKAMTGEDPMRGLRTAYKDEAGAAAILADKSLRARVSEKYHRVKPAFAQRGDLVMLDGNLGVCMGAHALFVSDDGLTRAAGWKAAWAVGRPLRG